MGKRRPPFTLLVSTLVAAAAIAIVLAGRGSTHKPADRPPTIGIGSARACVTTSAVARSADRSAIKISATAEAPVKVTEQAAGTNGIATVTRSELVTARVTADQPLEVTHTGGARATACARGNSNTAARTVALRVAYARALAAAHALATREAAEALKSLIHDQYPTILAQAKRRAAARARQLALAAVHSLAVKAQAEARQRAGAPAR